MGLPRSFGTSVQSSGAACRRSHSRGVRRRTDMPDSAAGVCPQCSAFVVSAGSNPRQSPPLCQLKASAGACPPAVNGWQGSPGCGLLPFALLVICVVSNATGTRFWHSSPAGPPDPLAHLLVTAGDTSGTSPPWHSKSVPSPPPPEGRALRVPVIPCPVSRRGGESPRRLSGSSSTGGRLAQSPVSRTANTRRRRCATPNHCESSTAHSTNPASPNATPSDPQPSAGTGSSHPAISPTTTAKSRPLLLLNAPGTFSQMSHRAPQRVRAALKILICSVNRPERSPSSPARLPATLRSWHGEPPITTSIGPSAAMSASVISVTLPRFGT